MPLIHARFFVDDDDDEVNLDNDVDVKKNKEDDDEEDGENKGFHFHQTNKANCTVIQLQNMVHKSHFNHFELFHVGKRFLPCFNGSFSMATSALPVEPRLFAFVVCVMDDDIDVVGASCCFRG